jgi:hypothetical protein
MHFKNKESRIANAYSYIENPSKNANIRGVVQGTLLSPDNIMAIKDIKAAMRNILSTEDNMT